VPDRPEHVRIDGRAVWMRGDVRCANAHDTTPEHLQSRDGYDAECNYCWLNIGHSQALHTKGRP